MTESTHRLTDERLCWLAVRDRLAKRADRRGPLGWLMLLLAAGGGSRAGRRGQATVGLANDDYRDARSDKMGDYAFAVDDAARTLSADERRQLRATGEVPDWFLADVQRRYAELRGR